jgi:hypothetical protein
MASCVRDNIVERARKAKYFSIILNCTQDLSHREQMKGYKPEVTNPQNCKKLVISFNCLTFNRPTDGQALGGILLPPVFLLPYSSCAPAVYLGSDQ